ncbi:MAG: shikimate kinase [Candidatus Omnitrophica bacterium]|nr:shikimate kinase [Candidatus Omnitrophota bacterium]
MENIYLVGFMASGKTVTGKELAKSQKWQFVDLDELIELREKRSIADVFAKEGEPYFRRVEKLTLKDVAAEKRFVVACGGGVVLDPDNLKLMKQTGKVICLSASAQTILKRTCATGHRPLLNVAEPKKQVELLLKLRAPYYAQADVKIDTDKLSVKEVVVKIVKIISKKQRK